MRVSVSNPNSQSYVTQTQAQKYVYLFSEGECQNRKLLGGKGAGLCEMTQIGLPVPSGFTISTEACLQYFANGNTLPLGLAEQVRQAMAEVERAMGLRFGDRSMPLLVSVRSGAAVSMPGMMDTVLNLGLNDQTVNGLIERSGDERFAWDSYRRFISLFGSIVFNVNSDLFHHAMEDLKMERQAAYDTDLSARDLQQLVAIFQKIVLDNAGQPVPQDPYQQLYRAIEAVFASWNGKRAIDYRKEFKITPDIANGTAVNVQTMVFGNLGDDSATGVAFTRDPATGENALFGDYLDKAQGEDIVAGIRTPKSIADMQKDMPQVYAELQRVRGILEKYFKEPQDMEFTVQNGKLYMLQTRNAKMNVAATIKTSVEMEKEGLITKERALMRVDPNPLTQLMYRQIDPKNTAEPVTVGLGVSQAPRQAKLFLMRMRRSGRAKQAKTSSCSENNPNPKTSMASSPLKAYSPQLEGKQAMLPSLQEAWANPA
jgi:pyruvate,orthophosphate dikinase